MIYIGTDTGVGNHPVGYDPKLHALVVGKTRTGKSTILGNSILELAEQGESVFVVDPHGPLVDFVKRNLPSHRKNDVFEFSREKPAPLNILASNYDYELALDASWSFIRDVWHKDFTAPQSEDIFKHSARALKDVGTISFKDQRFPKPHFGLIERMVSDEMFRRGINLQVKDQLVKDYFELTFDGDWDRRMRVEKSAPIQNKLHKFIEPVFRDIFCVSECIDVRKMIDEKKILLFNLSAADWGEDRSAFLGAVIGFLHQRALISRQDILDSGGEIYPSYAYWDEFLKFLGTNINIYLGESAKYGGRLTLATQTVAPFPDMTKEILLGNCGNFIIYRVGHKDAEMFANEFAGDIDLPRQAFIRLKNYHCWVQRVIEGTPQKPVLMQAYPPKKRK